MRRPAALSMIVCAAIVAQGQTQLRDALEWTAAQRGRMAEMTNRVVSIYGIASLAGLVCPLDRFAASGMYRDAISSLHTLSDTPFSEKGTTVLPAASFTGLWKYVVPAAVKCDPALTVLADNQRSKERVESERRRANATLARAWSLVDPDAPLDKYDQIDRAAQIANAALDAADPETFDFELLTKVMQQIADRAPELADDLFMRGIDGVMYANVRNPDSLQLLARFLFESNGSDSSFTISNATIENLMRTRGAANPDDVEALIEAAVEMLDDNQAVNRNPLAAWALGWQLLPHARELTPDRVETLQKDLDTVALSSATMTSQIQARLGSPEDPTQDSGGPAYRDFWLLGQVQSALAAHGIADARALQSRISDRQAREQVAQLILFRDAAEAIAAHSEQALGMANLLRPGIKRGLLYIAMIATAQSSDVAVQMLTLAAKDIAPLPAEQRVRTQSALAAALQRTSPDSAIAILQELVKSANDVRVNPRKGKFDPRGLNDWTAILGSSRGFYEAVQTQHGRRNFKLRAPRVDTFRLTDFVSGAVLLDPARLEAGLLGLLDENTRAGALVALGGLRIKLARQPASR